MLNGLILQFHRFQYFVAIFNDILTSVKLYTTNYTNNFVLQFRNPFWIIPILVIPLSHITLKKIDQRYLKTLSCWLIIIFLSQ